MAQISERLTSLGVQVFRVPEAATILLTGTGLSFSKFNREQLLTFETNLMKTQMGMQLEVKDGTFLISAKLFSLKLNQFISTNETPIMTDNIRIYIYIQR